MRRWSDRAGGPWTGATATTRGPFDNWPVLLGERLAGRATIDVDAEDSRRMSDLALRVWTAPSTTEARRALLALGELALRATLPKRR